MTDGGFVPLIIYLFLGLFISACNLETERISGDEYLDTELPPSDPLPNPVNPPLETVPKVLSFQILNSSTQAVISKVTQSGSSITEDFSTKPRTICVTLENAGSVRLKVGESESRIESSAPFCVRGDSNGQANQLSLPPGTYRMEAKAFSGVGATGTESAVMQLTVVVPLPVTPPEPPQPPQPPEPPVLPGNSLAALARSKGIMLGAAIQPGRLSGTYGTKFFEFANTMTGEVDFKPQNLMPTLPAKMDPNRDLTSLYDSKTLGRAKKMIEMACSRKMQIRGHFLAGASGAHKVPGNDTFWNAVRGNSNAEKADWAMAFLKNYVRTTMRIMKQYAVAKGCPNVIAHWDVVNESFNQNGENTDVPGYRLKWMPWGELLKNAGRKPDEWIKTAFRAARTEDPSVKLYLNEQFELEKLIPYAQYLKQQGIPIDGIAFQAHGLNYSKVGLANLLKAFAALGLDTVLSEMDVAMTPPVSTSERETQIRRWKNNFEGCLSAGTRCKGFITWGFRDNDYISNGMDYRDSELRASYEALLFDKNFTPKSPVNFLRDILQAL